MVANLLLFILQHNRMMHKAKVKERVQLYLYYPYGPSWHVLGRTSPFSFIHFPLHWSKAMFHNHC